MNKKQWWVLGIAFVLMGIFFIYEDMQYNCTNIVELSNYSIWCLINSEIRDAFIPIIMIFGMIVFPILGWLEKEK